MGLPSPDHAFLPDRAYIRAKEAVIIGKPNSGSAGDEGYLERFAKALRAGGLEEIEVLNTERADHATELAAMGLEIYNHD